MTTCDAFVHPLGCTPKTIPRYAHDVRPLTCRFDCSCTRPRIYDVVVPPVSRVNSSSSEAVSCVFDIPPATPPPYSPSTDSEAQDEAGALGRTAGPWATPSPRPRDFAEFLAPTGLGGLYEAAFHDSGLGCEVSEGMRVDGMPAKVNLAV